MAYHSSTIVIILAVKHKGARTNVHQMGKGVHKNPVFDGLTAMDNLPYRNIGQKIAGGMAPSHPLRAPMIMHQRFGIYRRDAIKLYWLNITHIVIYMVIICDARYLTMIIVYYYNIKYIKNVWFNRAVYLYVLIFRNKSYKYYLCLYVCNNISMATKLRCRHIL